MILFPLQSYHYNDDNNNSNINKKRKMIMIKSLMITAIMISSLEAVIGIVVVKISMKTKHT